MSLSDSEYNSASRDYNATARDYNATYKILVLGESGVGKTSLIRRFVENKFKESYLSTIGIDSYTKVINIGDERVRLQIWDTANQERFGTLTSAYYRGTMGIILVYDITEECTFSNINAWMNTIEQNTSSNVSRLLIGNKIDADPDKIIVTTSIGNNRAKQSDLQFFETSAKEGQMVSEAFMAMAKSINDKRKQRALYFCLSPYLCATSHVPVESMKEDELQQSKVLLENDSSNSSGRCC